LDLGCWRVYGGVKPVRCFVIGVGDGIRPGEMGKRVRYLFFFWLGGESVYSSIVVLAPLCGDVHKSWVYICELLGMHGWMPDPCNVSFLSLGMEFFLARVTVVPRLLSMNCAIVVFRLPWKLRKCLCWLYLSV
jgi:hypothetical protein